MMNPVNSQVLQQHIQLQMNSGYENWVTPRNFIHPHPNSFAMKPLQSGFKCSVGPRIRRKSRKFHGKRRTEIHRTLTEKYMKLNVYNPLSMNELQYQDRFKARNYLHRKFSKHYMNGNNCRPAPFAPRNTSSFIMRSKRSGGIAPLVSPYPETPAVLPTPVLSPLPEVLVDMAKEEWGVDGYGSMKGLIRLRSSSPAHDVDEDESVMETSSSGSDEEEQQRHMEVERRLDQDVSRFEMIYSPSSFNQIGMEYQNVLVNRVDDQDTHIEQLEEENLVLKERVFMMEKELNDLKRKMLGIENEISDDECVSVAGNDDEESIVDVSCIGE